MYVGHCAVEQSTGLTASFALGFVFGFKFDERRGGFCFFFLFFFDRLMPLLFAAAVVAAVLACVIIFHVHAFAAFSGSFSLFAFYGFMYAALVASRHVHYKFLTCHIIELLPDCLPACQAWSALVKSPSKVAA